MLLCIAASLLSILPQIQVQTTLPFLPHTLGTKTLVLRLQPDFFEATFLNFKAEVTQLLRGQDQQETSQQDSRLLYLEGLLFIQPPLF